MDPIFSHIFHTAIMVVIVGFGILSLTALSGGFDKWNKRAKRTH